MRQLAWLCSLAVLGCGVDGGTGTVDGGGAGGTGGGGTGGGGGGAHATGGTVATGGSMTGDGAAQGTDVCAGEPWYCIELCEGGQCSCACDAMLGCPTQMPEVGADCLTLSLCGYGEPGCRRIFDCLVGSWQEVANTCGDGGSGTCPATLEEALATPCLARSCGYETSVCSCRSPSCSGIFVEPSTMCAPPAPAVCQQPTVDGEPCELEGQVCGQTCCGRSYTCFDGSWHAQDNPCPP